MAKANITEAWLTKVAADESSGKPAKLPDGVAQERYWDTSPNSPPGFGVVIGRRFATFVVQGRVNGKQTMRTIGRWGRPGAGDDHGDVWTVTRARKEALSLVGAMEQGVDPKPEQGRQHTLADAFAAHVEKLRKMAKGGKRSEATIATFEKSKTYLEKYKLLDRPIGEVTGEVLRELHENIKRDAKPRANARNEKGAPLANRVITNIGTAWATLNKRLEGKLGNWNPAKAVDKETLVAKRVVLGVNKTADIADWYQRVTGKGEDGKHYMRNPIQRDGLVFALFTGLRSEDVRTIRFEHVDEEAGTLRLPDPKGGKDRAFMIPLPAKCLEIIERRRADNAKDLGRDDGDHGWAFPAVDSDGKVGPIGDLRQQVHEGKKHTRYPAEDVHTLRRSYTSVAEEVGISAIDQHVLTNHKFASGNVHQTYIAQHLDHLASCQAKIEAALIAKISPKPAPEPKRKPRAKLRSVPMSA